MIALPHHEPCGAAGLGELEADGQSMTIVCTVRRKWVAGLAMGWTAVDSPGCGAVTDLDHWGRRVIVRGAVVEPAAVVELAADLETGCAA